MIQENLTNSLQKILSTFSDLRCNDQITIKNAVNGLIDDAASLDSKQLLDVFIALDALVTNSSFRNEWKRTVKEKRKEIQCQTNRACNQMPSPIYFERNSCLFICSSERDELLIASFTARITCEITDEAGNRWFVIDGKTKSDQTFQITVSVADFCNDARLITAILQAAGVSAVVQAGRERHIRPAIQFLTTEPPTHITRYSRTGWRGEAFLISGMVNENTFIELPEKLPYRVDAMADLTMGMHALEALVHAQETKKVLVALTLPFQAPLAKPMGWQSERYGLFIIGQSGSFKTSIASLAVALYGPEFQNEGTLIRCGPGSTVNAITTYATFANDLPILIDNFKPNTGLGVRGLVNIIHAIMEGGEKDRLNRTYELKIPRPIHSWPIFTGEDILSNDPASIARLLIVELKPMGSTENLALSEAQRLAPHLNAVGFTWLQWLQRDEAKEVINHFKNRVPEFRRSWLAYLKNAPQVSVNAARIATNLATNEITWRILEHHPALGDFANRYRDQHYEGLTALADKMSQLTSQALEASIFLETLQELLTSGRSKLLPAFELPVDSDKSRFVGWRGADGSTYLLPNIVRQVVEAVLQANGGLNQMSNHAVYAQLDNLGLIQSRDGGRHCKTIRDCHGKTQKTLHLSAAAFDLDD